MIDDRCVLRNEQILAEEYSWVEQLTNSAADDEDKHLDRPIDVEAERPSIQTSSCAMTSKQSQSSGGSGGLHSSAAPVRALVQQYRAHGSIESLLLALQHPISMRVLRAQQRSDSATSLLAQMPLPSSPEPFHQPLIEHLPTLCRDLHESYRWWLEEYRLPSAVELRIASLNAIRLLTILARCRALELSTATQLADSISQQAFATAGHLQSLHQPLLQPPPQTQSACSQQFELRKDREMQDRKSVV